MPVDEQRFRLVTSPDRPLQLAYDAFMIAQEAARHSPLTIKWYEQRLGSFLTFLHERQVNTPDGITPTECRTFIVILQRQGLAANTVHGYAQVVKTFCRFLEREEFSPTDPMARVKMPKVPKVIQPSLSPSDVRQLLDASTSSRDRAIVLCLLDSGLRAREFCVLRIADVDLRAGTVRVVKGKGGKDRTAYLGAKARRALVRYLRERGTGEPCDSLWLSKATGKGLTHWGLAQLLKRLGMRAEVDHCSPHTFRRTFALWSLRAGMSIYHLQAIMGHADLQTLQRYLALVEADAKEAHRKFGAVDNML